jgi:hypothetical protein
MKLEIRPRGDEELTALAAGHPLSRAWAGRPFETTRKLDMSAHDERPHATGRTYTWTGIDRDGVGRQGRTGRTPEEMAAKVEHYFGQGWREVCAAEGWDPPTAGTWLAPAIDRHPDIGARRWRAAAGHPREPEPPRADGSVLSAAASRDTAGWIRGRRVPASGRRRSRGPRTGPGGQRLDAGPAARPRWLRRSGLRAATCRYSRQAGLTRQPGAVLPGRAASWNQESAGASSSH